MVHNPIYSKHEITLLKLPRLTIPLGMVGLLYHNRQFIQPIHSGEESRRFHGHTIYVVDVNPHFISLAISVMDKEMIFPFPIQVSVKYRVADAKRMIADSIYDTEQIVHSCLEPLIQSAKGNFFLYERKELLRYLQAEADSKADRLLAVQGLQLLETCQVRVRPDDNFLEEEKIAIGIKVIVNLPQFAIHNIKLPASALNTYFSAEVSVQYRVENIGQLAGGNHQQAENSLWPKINILLSEKSREFLVENINLAQKSINELVKNCTISGGGIVIESVTARLDLDEETKGQINNKKVEQAKRDKELEAQEHKIKLASMMQNLLEQYYKSGDLRLIDLAMNPGLLSQAAAEQEAYKAKLNLSELEFRKLQLDILHESVSKDTFGDRQDELINLLFQSLQRAMPGSNKELQDKKDLPALSSGIKDTDSSPANPNNTNNP